MWRINPLLKMTVRTVVVASVLTVVEFAVWHIFLGFDYQPQYVSAILDNLYYGALVGLYAAAAMILATVIFFREIRRPMFYRFAMSVLVLLALLVLIEVPPITGVNAETWLIQLLPLISIAFLVFACSVVARLYAKESLARKLALEAKEAEDFKTTTG